VRIMKNKSVKRKPNLIDLMEVLRNKLAMEVKRK
jgi:hypothetical protein